MDRFKSRTVKYKDLADKPDKVLMPDGTLAYPSDDTLIRVDEEGKPLDYSKLAKGNYAEVNEDGSYTSVKQLPEIIVTFTPKKRFIEKVNDAVTGFVNDNILMNKDNIRGKNMEKALSTESGKKIIKDIAEGQAIGGAAAIAGATLPILEVLAPYIPEMVGSYAGGKAVDLGVKAFTDYNTWGEAVSDITGLPIWLAEMTNLGSLYGGWKGNWLKSNAPSFKQFIYGDGILDPKDIHDKALGFSNLLRPKEHWIFKGGFTPTNVVMATANRIMPFLSNIEKTPLRLIAYQAGKRSKGNASIGLKDIFKNESSYIGTTIAGEGKNNLAFYLFREDPIIKHTKWFKDISKKFVPASKKYFKPISDDVDYYKMDTVIPQGDYINFDTIEDLLAYAPINKPVVKDTGMIIKLGDKDYKIILGRNGNAAGLIDDGGHHKMEVFVDSKGELKQRHEDIIDFDGLYAKNNANILNLSNYIRTSKQGHLMNKAGTPFGLYGWNRISIGGPKNRLYLNESDIPVRFKSPYRKSTGLNPVSIYKAQQGGIIELLYTPQVKQDESPTLELPDISIDIPFMDLDNPFSDIDVSDYRNTPEYNKEEYDIDKTVESTQIITDQTFDSAYDAVEAQYPIASKYRTLLTLIAEQESGFNPHAKNPNAPAYGYFQFMQGDRWNNISEYAGVDINTFLNNPEIQIKAAVDLAQAFENSFTEEDIKKAESLGYGMDSMIAGAWLAGAGGVKKFIWEGINRDDKHWSPEGAGVSVKQIMDKYA